MLNFTNEEKAIIKSDESVKNFRVHFPSGELPDITNESIVFDTVKFTESVCSDNTFRFGRVEASTIEFEMVGVPNIIGATIECSMEYTNGGTTVSVPYGTFIVDSCPRDHQDMTHRKVTAYSSCAWHAEKSFETYKSKILRYIAQTYNPVIDYVIGSLSESVRSEMTETQLTPGYLNTQSIQLNGFTCIEAVDPEDSQKVICASYYSDADPSAWDAKNYYISFESTGISGTNMDPDAVYKIIVPKGDDYEQFKQIVYENAAAKEMTVNTDLLKDFAHIRCTSSKESFARYRVLLTGGAYMDEYDDRFELVLYPYIMLNSADGREFLSWSFICGRFDIGYSESSGTGMDEIYAENIEIFKTPVVYQYKITDTYAPRALFDYTEEVTDDDDLMYSFRNAYDINDMLQGYAESKASVVRVERSGDISVIHLDNSSPYELTAADVSGSAWWDEYDVQPIGTVYFKCDTEDGEKPFGYTFSEDPSVYDMSDNNYFGSIVIEPVEVTAVGYMSNPNYLYLLNGDLYYYNGTEWTSAGTYMGPMSIIILLLNIHFVPYADTVQFTPLDANFRAMPFLQCGDAIRLTAKDGAVIDSYVLNHTFTGNQYIDEDVQTVQGTVTGSEVQF